MQKEYDKVFTNFKKLGNHHNSLRKSAMDVSQKEALSDDDSVESSMNSADISDIFGQEQCGFCCFTNSVVHDLSPTMAEQAARVNRICQSAHSG